MTVGLVLSDVLLLVLTSSIIFYIYIYKNIRHMYLFAPRKPSIKIRPKFLTGSISIVNGKMIMSLTVPVTGGLFLAWVLSGHCTSSRTLLGGSILIALHQNWQ